MAKLLRGAPVAAALKEKAKEKAGHLRENGIIPTLAIVRVGERPDDAYYEQAASKTCEAVGICVKRLALPENVTQGELLSVIEGLSDDAEIHGILLMRPLPKKLCEREICAAVAPEKDVDGVTRESLASVFTGEGTGFPPCTARGCMELLRYYGIEVSGKRAAVLGRSLVIGRPVAAMLLSENATVTVCHSGTVNMPEITRNADIVVSALGRAEMLGGEYFSAGQTVLDVGMSRSEKKEKFCGDADFDAVCGLVGAITPVPGGVGAVTTAVLALHTAEAAENITKIQKAK